MASPQGNNCANHIGPDDTHWIATQDQLKHAARAWQRCTWLGVDTEFVRERTYHARLGLVQIGDGDSIWLIDPLAVTSLTPLGDVLEAPSTVKIFHSAREDLEVLHHHTGRKAWPLFDTQRAAALSGFPLQCAYANLVESLLGVIIPKGTARTNWLHRPLRREQLDYAAADVRYLPAMARELQTRLEEKDRGDWLREDLEQLSHQALRVPDPQTQYRRIRGAAELRDDSLARLQALAAWRELTARQRDLPRGFLLRDEELLALAANGAKDDGAVRDLVSSRSSAYRHDAGTLAAILSTPGLAPEPAPGALDPAQRRRVKRLQEAVRTCAEHLGIEPALLASRRDLEHVVRQPPIAAGDSVLKGWRGRLLGTELNAILADAGAA